MPEVSVIIPSYNSARYLVQAVESVLGQTFADHEVLVVDDGSTDDTEAVMRPYGSRIRYVRQPNGGVSAARNRGLQESQGRYVAFLDADDTWFPNKLKRQLAALAQQPAYKVCYSAFVVVDSQLTPLGIKRERQDSATLETLLTQGNKVGSICTVLAERSLFAEGHQFDSQLSQCADWDMWVQLATQTPFLYLDEPLVTYRQHQANMSRSAQLLEKDSLRVLEKGFALPNLSPSLRAQQGRAFARNYVVLAGTYYHAGEYRATGRCLAQALLHEPRQLCYAAGFPTRLWSRWQQRRLAGAG